MQVGREVVEWNWKYSKLKVDSSSLRRVNIAKESQHGLFFAGLYGIKCLL